MLLLLKVNLEHKLCVLKAVKAGQMGIRRRNWELLETQLGSFSIGANRREWVKKVGKIKREISASRPTDEGVERETVISKPLLWVCQ